MVKEVIPTFDDSHHQRLRVEAQAWRLPYWDWAAKKQGAVGEPAGYDTALILKDRSVDVMTPTGIASIPNPMYEYTTTVPMGDLGITSVQWNDPADPPAKVRYAATCASWAYSNRNSRI